MIQILDSAIEPLRTDFNVCKGSLRFLAVLSPT
jgi:hypothetical protein